MVGPPPATPEPTTAAPPLFPGQGQGVLDVEFENTFYDQVQAQELARLNALATATNDANQLRDATAVTGGTSLRGLLDGTLAAMIAIIGDLSKGRPLVDVFLAADRILYVGLVLLALALGLWLVDVTA